MRGSARDIPLDDHRGYTGPEAWGRRRNRDRRRPRDDRIDGGAAPPGWVSGLRVVTSRARMWSRASRARMIMLRGVSVMSTTSPTRRRRRRRSPRDGGLARATWDRRRLRLFAHRGAVKDMFIVGASRLPGRDRERPAPTSRRPKRPAVVGIPETNALRRGTGWPSWGSGARCRNGSRRIIEWSAGREAN